MQRFISIFLLTLYLTTNIGLYSSFHWCGGELAATKFFSSKAESCCGDEDAKEKNGCCENEIKVWAVDDDQKTTEYVDFQFVSVIALPPESVFIFKNSNYLTAFKQAYSSPYSKPPNVLTVPIYIKNCVFRV